MSHELYMRNALTLATRGVGQTAPNPSVGCVVVKDGIIISRARTAKGGRPHAEALALDGIDAKGATIYVTLEPCSHHGKTPPCAEKIVKAKPAEVVIACLDPDPRVNGKGVKMLEKAGIKVTIGVCEKEALEINRGFFKRIKTGLPFLTLKAAISADRKFLEGKGKPTWVTGELARNYVHLMRARNDVLITGTGTILADNPQLNVRLSGMEDLSPRILVLGKRKLPKQYEKLATHSSPLATLKALAADGINNVMVEAGTTLANAFIKKGLVDELVIIQSPTKIGKKGKDYFSQDALKSFKKTSEKQIGEDRIITLRFDARQ